MSQIQISYFSCHFYVVNVILLSVLHFWTNFDTKKILFIFYDSFFKAMTFSECPEAFQEISDRLVLTDLHAALVLCSQYGFMEARTSGRYMKIILTLDVR